MTDRPLQTRPKPLDGQHAAERIRLIRPLGLHREIHRKVTHTGFIRAATGNIQNRERSGTYALVSGDPVRARSPLDSPAGTTEPKGRWGWGWQTMEHERETCQWWLAARGL